MSSMCSESTSPNDCKGLRHVRLELGRGGSRDTRESRQRIPHSTPEWLPAEL